MARALRKLFPPQVVVSIDFANAEADYYPPWQNQAVNIGEQILRPFTYSGDTGADALDTATAYPYARDAMTLDVMPVVVNPPTSMFAVAPSPITT